MTVQDEVEQDSSGIMEELMAQLQEAQEELAGRKGDIQQLSFMSPVVILSKKPVVISAVLLAPGRWKGKVYTAEEIKKAAEDANGKYGDVNHGEDPIYQDKVVGESFSTEWNDTAHVLLFKAKVTDEQAQRDVISGKFRAVSARFRSDDVVGEDGQVYATNIKFIPNEETPKAWTLTDFPACERCYILNVEQALSKAGYAVTPGDHSMSGPEGYPYGLVEFESRIREMQDKATILARLMMTMMKKMMAAGIDMSDIMPSLQPLIGTEQPPEKPQPEGSPREAPNQPTQQEVERLSNQPGEEGKPPGQPGQPAGGQPAPPPGTPAPTQVGVSKEDVERLVTEKTKAAVDEAIATMKTALDGKLKETSDGLLKKFDEKLVALIKPPEGQAGQPPAPPAGQPGAQPPAAPPAGQPSGTPGGTPAQPPAGTPAGTPTGTPAGTPQPAPAQPQAQPPAAPLSEADLKAARKRAREHIKQAQKDGKLSAADLLVAVHGRNEEEED